MSKHGGHLLLAALRKISNISNNPPEDFARWTTRPSLVSSHILYSYRIRVALISLCIAFPNDAWIRHEWNLYTCGDVGWMERDGGRMDGEGWSVYGRASQAFCLDDWKIGDDQKISSVVRIVGKGDVFFFFFYFFWRKEQRWFNKNKNLRRKFFLR